MKFLLLEDDNIWAEEVIADLRKAFPGAEITRIATECAFRRKLDSLAITQFDVAVFDIMVRWASVTEILDHNAMEQVPSEVQRELNGEVKWRAGVRCCQLLADKLREKRMPLPASVFFSVLSEADLANDGTKPSDSEVYVSKAAEGTTAGASVLVTAIHNALKARRDRRLADY
jgi:hypothetical protein